MRIGIDARPFQAQFAGTRRYTLELCRALDACLPEAEFFVYGNRTFELPVQSNRWKQVGDTSSILSRLPPTIWYGERVGTLLKNDSIDVFWGAANFLPRGFQRGKGSCKSLLTVLDLVPELFAQTMGLKHKVAHHLYFRQSIRSADRVVTISEGSRDRIAQFYGRQADAVIYPCASPHFRLPSDAEIARIKAQYDLQAPYFLAVATLEPRKNLDVLIQAMIELKSRRRRDVPDLVLVGQMGWKAERLMQVIEQARSCGVRIVQTGFVQDADLPGLYGASSAFVFPSRYEGFGIPVLEAIRCGARVLASDVPEIREAGGQYASYFEPTLAGVTRALEEHLQQGSGRREYMREIDIGSTWHEQGRKLAEVIRSLL